MLRIRPLLVVVPFLLTACSSDSSANGDDAETSGSSEEGETGEGEGGDGDGDGDGEMCDMASFEAGSFGMGCNAGVDMWCANNTILSQRDELPHVVTLDAFSIDCTEVTQAEYQACIEDKGCPNPVNYCDNSWDPETYPDHPAVCVNLAAAEAYCAWVGKRLPTEAEWERAARGTTGRLYPWGNDEITCDHVQHGDCLGDTPQSILRPVGSFPLGATPEGVHDMAGNALEWTSDRFEVDYYENSPESNPAGGEHSGDYAQRGAAAGWWADEFGNAYRTSARVSAPGGSAGPWLGFRCARSEAEQPVCGNGMVETGEVCDDGNSDDNDGCNSQCDRGGAILDYYSFIFRPEELDPFQVPNTWGWSGNLGNTDALLLDDEFLVAMSTFKAPDFKTEQEDRRVNLTGTPLATVAPWYRDEPAMIRDVTTPDQEVTISDSVIGANGNYFAIGTSRGADDQSIVIYEFSSDPSDYDGASGGLVSECMFTSGAVAVEGIAIELQESTGHLIVGGTTDDGAGVATGWLAAWDPAATNCTDLVWEAQLGVTDDHTPWVVRDLVLTGSGDIVVAGSATTGEGGQVWVAKLDGTGTQSWSTVYDGPQTQAGANIDTEQAQGVAVAGDGTIVAVGGVTSETGQQQIGQAGQRDGVILRFDTDGALLFEATHGDEQWNDGYSSVIVHPNGDVYVGGNIARSPMVERWAIDGTEAKWMSSPFRWDAIGGNYGGSINRIIVAPDETLIVGGSRGGGQPFAAHVAQ